ncbi:MAG: hypothetical protein AAFU71_01285 [Cyanobacteria bacterium J06632_22]
MNFFRKRFLLALLGAISVTGCAARYETGEVVRETAYSADPYQITEEVQYVSTDWDGEVLYQRVYVVEEQAAERARFTGGETYWAAEMDFPESDPKQVGDWLVVFSLDQVWIWQPGQSAIAFDPTVSLDADVWQDNQMERPEFWSFYLATDFQIVEDQWVLEYTNGITDDAAPSPGPEKYYFISEDKGETFVPAPDGSL